MSRFASIEEGCKEYIDILSGPANGWGQNVGVDGASHNTLAKLNSQFGKEAVQSELNRQFTAMKENAVAALDVA